MCLYAPEEYPAPSVIAYKVMQTFRDTYNPIFTTPLESDSYYFRIGNKYRTIDFNNHKWENEKYPPCFHAVKTLAKATELYHASLDYNWNVTRLQNFNFCICKVILSGKIWFDPQEYQDRITHYELAIPDAIAGTEMEILERLYPYV